MDEWMRLRESYRPSEAPPAPDPRPYPPYGSDPDERASERAARLTLTCLGASVTVLVIGLVVFFTVRTLREDAKDATPTLKTAPVTTPEDAARLVGGIGPAAGTDVPTYENTRKQALATATGDRMAVVSLSDYTTEAKARAAVGSAEVVALLAAAPGGQPAVVTSDLAGWVNSQTADAKADRDEIQRLLPTVEDPSFKTFYRSELDRLNKLLSTIKPTGNLVYAVAVRAPAADLQALAARDGIRLVDVGPGADPDPKANYRGLRPEETAKANDPNTRPN